MAKRPSKPPSKSSQLRKKPARPAGKATAGKRTTARPASPKPAGVSVFATLIGIDAYPENELNGCIRDVLEVDLLLRELTGQQAEKVYNPIYLLAPNSTDKKLIQDYEAKRSVKIKSLSPTFDNITTKAFAHLKQARPGDVCVFYYSGHGSHTQAPEVFWHTKPGRQNETLVCVDSRTDKSRDIIDKEIACLLWDALEGKKDVHCLVITDCCHSGGMTRAMRDDNGVKVRQLQPSRNDVPLEQYIGFKTGYYKVKNKRADIAIARYVHLAACRDNELAQENMNGGLFTKKLIEMLRSGGGAKSYQDLSTSLAITVQGKAGRQNPISFARVPEDLDLVFLGGKVKPYTPSFEIRYDAIMKNWVLYGGQMHGINADGGATIRIAGTDDIVKVVSAGIVTAILDKSETVKLKTDQSYTGSIASLGNLSIGVGIASDVGKTKTSALRKAYHDGGFANFKLFEDSSGDIDYLVHVTEDDAFSLIKRGSSTSVIMPEKEPDTFLDHVDAVGKWISTLTLVNNNSNYTAADFAFSAERIEGEAITAQNAESLEGRRDPVKPDVGLTLSYVGEQQPALRFRIAIPPTSKIRSCYVGALWLDFEYGISSQFLPQEGTLLRAGEELDLNYISKTDVSYKTIPLSIPTEYRAAGISEACDYIKVIVSTVPMRLKSYDQQRLKLFVPRSKSRSAGFDEEAPGKKDESDWAVFTFPVRLLGPNKIRAIEPGTNDFQSFTLQAPNAFAATAFLVSQNDISRKVSTVAMRGMNEVSDRALRSVSPPASLWGDEILVEDAPFNNGLGMQSNGLEALELMPSADGWAVALQEGAELLITPRESLARTRSLDTTDEFILPYGYDDKSGLYFPIGYSDQQGNIHIQSLPDPTPGKLSDNESLISTRSLGGSVKLFFKKFLHRNQDLNTLVLYKVDKQQGWTRVTTDPVEMKKGLQKAKGSRVLMLIHGITGDTRHMVESLKGMTDLHKDVSHVLTYDYENLSTPLEKTGKLLKDSLATAGFGNVNGMPALTIIAHSMGGLISRRLIESEGGNDFVRHLILVGVPCGGSEIATLGKSVLGLITHAMNVTGPIKLAISGLCFLLKKMELNLTGTLEQLQPRSDFIKALTRSKLPAGVKVSIIGGDTALLKKKYDGDDFFLKRLSESLAKGVVYPGLSRGLYGNELNDMAVTLKSMKDINDYGTSVKTNRIVASNHLAYFREKICQQELLALIKSTK